MNNKQIIEHTCSEFPSILTEQEKDSFQAKCQGRNKVLGCDQCIKEIDGQCELVALISIRMKRIVNANPALNVKVNKSLLRESKSKVE